MSASTSEGCEVFLYNWQSLIAGLLGLLAGLVAFGGALIAAYLQVRAMRQAAAAQITAARQAADDQVAAVQRQLADTQAAREESDRRRRSVIEWAARAEGRRIETVVWALKPDGGGGLPSAPGWHSRTKEQLVIESSPLLRGAREDMALLDDGQRTLLKNIADVLHRYNVRIQTANVGMNGIQIVPEVLLLIEQLGKLAAELCEV